MRSVDDKRVTRVQPYQVALLQQPLPENGVGVSPASEPKFKPGPLPPGARPVRRSATPSLTEPSGKVIRGSPRGLALQETGRLGNNAGSDLVVRDESPWDTFKKYYECDLAGTVAVCVRASGNRAARAIRRFSSKDSDNILGILRSTSHKNVASIWECFRTPDALYTLSEFDPLALHHIVACKAFPDQQQLAAIMSQVCSSVISAQIYQVANHIQFLDGLSYLIAQNFHHTSLDSSSVLMSLNGEVKIGKLII
jgi:serine/threonine protein kinase